MRRIGLLVLIGAGLLPAAGCKTHAEKLAKFRGHYHVADFEGADQEIDQLIAKEARADVEEVDRTNASQVRAGKGDTYLLLLEKGMTQLALGQPEIANRLFRTARDQLDEKMARNVTQYFASVFSDDRALDYQGADYEHILVRVLLCLSDLLVHSSQTGGDAYAYAIQVGEKQEEIIKSPLGEDAGYQPRKNYKRVGIGAYLQGMILEATGAPDEAAKVYRRCVDYEPGFRMGKAALERARNGRYAQPGEGVLHVFYLSGPGPFYVEGKSPPTDLALRIAQLVAAIMVDSPVPLMQSDVPVPVHVFFPAAIPPLPVSAGSVAVKTETLLDVNQVSAQQLEAMMPMIIARAVLRRAVKAAITTAASEAGKKKNKGSTGDWIEFGAAMANLIWTAAERADTRLWTSLPARIQVARVPLRAGNHVVKFGAGIEESIRIDAGRDSYALVIRPDLRQAGVLLVDRFSLGPPLDADPVP